MAATEQFTAFYEANGRAAQRYAAATVEGAQRLLRVQMEATRDVMELQGERWREAMTRMDPTRTADWPSIVNLQMQLAMDMTRSSMEGAARVYGEYVRAVQEQGRVISEAFQDVQRRGEDLGMQGMRDNERAAEEAGRRAAEAVSHMSGQVAGSAHAAQQQSEEQRRRGTAKA